MNFWVLEFLDQLRRYYILQWKMYFLQETYLHLLFSGVPLWRCGAEWLPNGGKTPCDRLAWLRLGLLPKCEQGLIQLPQHIVLLKLTDRQPQVALSIHTADWPLWPRKWTQFSWYVTAILFFSQSFYSLKVKTNKHECPLSISGRLTLLINNPTGHFSIFHFLILSIIWKKTTWKT